MQVGMHRFQSLNSKTLKEMVVHNRGIIVHFCMGTNTDHYSPASDFFSPLEKGPDKRGALCVTEEKGFSTA